MSESLPVLLLTVGTGDIDKLRETLLKPLIQSIQQGAWQRIILLPSQFTRAYAEQVQSELEGHSIEVSELPVAGAENDVDASYNHFDLQIAGLLASGLPPAKIVVDFTRGTKSMSAALVLAAVRRRLPTLRYIHSQQRDDRGMVVPGTEEVGEFQTAAITESRRLDDSQLLMRRGAFPAARELLQAGIADNAPLDAARQLAQFCASWDRLDYRTAAETGIPRVGHLPESWRQLAAREEHLRWVRQLTADNSLRQDRSRLLVVDLLANARRRLRASQFEDGLLRAYRIIDLLCQSRLSDRGHDPVKERKGQWEMLEQLNHERDPLARSLRNVASRGPLSGQKRNKSILIHGYWAIDGGKAHELEKLLSRLEVLILEDNSEAKTHLSCVNWLAMEE